MDIELFVPSRRRKKLRPIEPVWLLIDGAVEFGGDAVCPGSCDADSVEEVVPRRFEATGVVLESSSVGLSISRASREEEDEY